MSVMETRAAPSRETSVSSGGFSHSQTGITAVVPVTAAGARACGRCASSERHSAVARSTKPLSEAPGTGEPVPGAAMPMSSSETGLLSRLPSTSQIRSGTWPRGRCPFSQRATAVCSYRSRSPRGR